MKQQQKQLYKCSWCGAMKPLYELNGVDFLINDDSHATCRKIFECDSDTAKNIVDKLITALETRS